MGKTFTENERLEAFAKLDNELLNEGTSTYHKFLTPGEKFDGIFKGIESRVFDERMPDKTTECAVVTGIDGENHLFAQTIIVKELKKKWDELKETGFCVRIIYKGMEKAGTPEQYQSFRLLFEK